MTAADLLTIQQEINGKNYRANAQAEDWVGKSIGQLLEIDPHDTAGREKLKAMISIWVKSGALKIVPMKDSRGKDRPVVVVGEWATR